jgi:predicted methyltransferase MtxX (methanogen marker protein 4)
VSDLERAASLLTVAREALRRELAPELAGEQRYLAAMIANAMAIAARALEQGGGAEAAELEALERLYPDARSVGLDETRRCLVEELRTGKLDGVADRLVRGVLKARVQARLALSNPTYRD